MAEMKTNTGLEEELKVDPSTLLGQWRKKAYDQNTDKEVLRRFWANYFDIEKGIYAKLLENPDEGEKSDRDDDRGYRSKSGVR